MKSGICRPQGYPWLAAAPLPLRRRHVLSGLGLSPGLREDVSSKHQPQTPPRETCQAVFRKQRIKNFSLADKFTSLRAQWSTAAGKNLGLRGQLGDEVAGEISGQISGRRNSSTGPGFRYRRASLIQVKDDSWKRSKIFARALVVVSFPLPSPPRHTWPLPPMLARPAPMICRTAPGCCSAAAAPEPARITATQMFVMGFHYLQCYFWVSDISHPWGQDSHLNPLSQNSHFCTVDGNPAPFSVELAAISTDRCQVLFITEHQIVKIVMSLKNLMLT